MRVSDSIPGPVFKRRRSRRPRHLKAGTGTGLTAAAPRRVGHGRGHFEGGRFVFFQLEEMGSTGSENLLSVVGAAFKEGSGGFWRVSGSSGKNAAGLMSPVLFAREGGETRPWQGRNTLADSACLRLPV